MAGDRASMTAPLLAGAEAIGVLHVGFRQARTFDATDRSVVQILAGQCAQGLERARLHEEEQEARERAERRASRLRRLQTVVDATFASGSLDELLLELLVRLREAVGSDTATILIVDESGEALVERESIGFEAPSGIRVPIGEGFAGTIAATRTQRVVPDISKIVVVNQHLRRAGIVSLAGVPLVADGRLVGVVHVGSKGRREFDREDLLLLRLVAGRAAVAIDRAQEHEREHRIAEILQRSLLPEALPALADVEIAARYVPGTSGVAVGGDWYDVFELGGGSFGIAVGDVVGHGVRAAAATGRLRHVLRAYAVDGLGPADALARLNRLVCDSPEETFATVVFAVVDPTRTRVRLASAGHPPVLVRSVDGTVRPIEGGRSLPVGATALARYSETEVRTRPGSTLVLYSDGLVERRHESIDTGIERLARLVESNSGPLEGLAAEIVTQLEEAGHSDDVALLAVRLRPVAEPRFSLCLPAKPDALAAMRHALRSWLAAHGVRADEIFDTVVAANEACTNAVEHPLDPTRPELTLEAELAGDDVTIVVRDAGRWRPEGLPGDRGRGLGFMRALMTGVDVQPSAGGTTVVLRRQLNREAAA
jgi:serine phosphatase RsbU (regulator of sigma subunit)/anti-sigma regulatory factor (Ser/Thr protein kinase)